MEDNENLKKFEKKDPLWIEFHILENKIKEKDGELDNLIYNIIRLANIFLNKYSKKEDLKEIIIAFENLINSLVYYYGEDAKKICENDNEGKILSSFDSLIFDYNYDQEIQKIKKNIQLYLNSVNKND